MIEIPRHLLGYVENGTETTVELFQDDATRSWFVKVGRRTYFSETSIEDAIQKAVDDNPPEEWEK